MTGSQQNAVAGAVLCGGKSSRLGGDKARAELGGKPLLDHVIERLQPQVEDVVLSVEQDHAGNPDSAYRQVRDLAPSHRGPLIGLYSVLKSLEDSPWQWLALCPCDAPFLPRDLVDRLLRAAHDAHNAVAVARYDGIVQPTFSVWRADTADAIGALVLEQGRGGLMAMLDRLDYAVEDWEQGEPPPFFNINTPQDLERARQLLDDGAGDKRV
ncbi:MAG: molybdenum cofactor guanylyltransferase [Xanthomonadales bacterium]|nr:molybdenum cofactor guanylyltransferase [Xanthomonadales bacterium]